MNYGTKKIGFVICCVLILSAACAKQSPATPKADVTAASVYNQTLMVENNSLRVEVINTPEKMAQGLSGREKMASDEGMLFVFAKPGSHTFWMKDMKFSLDFIWISNGKIIGITKNAPAPSAQTKVEALPRYNPPLPIDKVLEVNAGWADRNKIKIGDSIFNEQK